MDNLTGRTLGHYQLLDEVGRGGMAVVYRAHQPSVARDVAIKILSPAIAHNPAFVDQFYAEARAAAQLQHPHILPVHDFGKANGLLYIVMTYIEGGTLATRLNKHPHGLSLTEVVQITTEISDALEYAHEQDVIHRDIKSANIMLDRHGHAYLADFGLVALARALPAPGEALVGTYEYLAPELANGLPATRLTDIYALGVVLYEMLTGQRPFQASDPVELITLHREAPIPDVRYLRPEAPVGVQLAVAQALAKDPEARPPRAPAMARVLARAVETLPPEIRDTLPGSSLLPDIDAAPAGDTPHAPLPPRQPLVEARAAAIAITRRSSPTEQLARSDLAPSPGREFTIRLSLPGLVGLIVLALALLGAVLIGLRATVSGSPAVGPTQPAGWVETLPPFLPTLSIDQPQDGDRVEGAFAVYGSAYLPENFAYYTVEVGEGEEPIGWSVVRERVPYAVENNLLAEVEAGGYPAGPVTIRVSIYDSYGRRAERRVTVIVAP